MEIVEILSDLLGILSIQTILISMELGSKISIAVSMQNEKFIKRIKNSLKTYLNNAVTSMFIVSLYMFISYGAKGAFIGVIVNSLIILWIYNQYYNLIMK